MSAVLEGNLYNRNDDVTFPSGSSKCKREKHVFFCLILDAVVCPLVLWFLLMLLCLERSEASESLISRLRVQVAVCSCLLVHRHKSSPLWFCCLHHWSTGTHYSLWGFGPLQHGRRPQLKPSVLNWSRNLQIISEITWRSVLKSATVTHSYFCCKATIEFMWGICSHLP